MRSKVSSYHYVCFLFCWCRFSSIKTVQGVKIHNALFGYFRLLDLERLRDDNRWLSDSHVTFALRFVHLLTSKKISQLHLNVHRHFYSDFLKRNVWGEVKVELLDTTFWESLSRNPSKYSEKQRKKQGLVECDFAIMPMFGGLWISSSQRSLLIQILYSAIIGGWELWRSPTSSWREKRAYVSQTKSLFKHQLFLASFIF